MSTLLSLKNLTLSLTLLFTYTASALQASETSNTDTKMEALSMTLDVEELKAEILDLANEYGRLALEEREGDETLEKQNTLVPLVNRLIDLNPQPPASERISTIAGVWKQVWGPYNYKSEERIVTDDFKVDEIYQVVFEEGHYYNVSPNKFFFFEYISLLRGEFSLSETNPNGLDVRFTNLDFNLGRPKNTPIWELASLAEAEDLPRPFNVFPNHIVENNFEGGTLNEVYTDETLRILYGTSEGSFKVPFIYIMERVVEL